MTAAPHAIHQATGRYYVITTGAKDFPHTIVAPDGTVHDRNMLRRIAERIADSLNAEDRANRSQPAMTDADKLAAIRERLADFRAARTMHDANAIATCSDIADILAAEQPAPEPLADTLHEWQGNNQTKMVAADLDGSSLALRIGEDCLDLILTATEGGKEVDIPITNDDLPTLRALIVRAERIIEGPL